MQVALAHTTSLYAAILAIMLCALSLRVLLLRRKHKVQIGDGGVIELLRASRVQANFIEYVPLALLLMLLMEMRGVSSLWIHAFGALLIFARVMHALGVSQTNEKRVFRIIGIATTLNLLFIGAATLLLKSPVF